MRPLPEFDARRRRDPAPAAIAVLAGVVLAVVLGLGLVEIILEILEAVR